MTVSIYNSGVQVSDPGPTIHLTAGHPYTIGEGWEMLMEIGSDSGGAEVVLRVTFSTQHCVLNLSGSEDVGIPSSDYANITFVEGADGTEFMTVQGQAGYVNGVMNGMTLTPAPDYTGPAGFTISAVEVP